MNLFKSNKTAVYLLLSFCTILFLSGCFGCQNGSQTIYEGEPMEPVKINRFERELFSVKTDQLEPSLEKLFRKYGDFYFYYAQDMLAMPFEGDSLFTRQMRMLLDYAPFRKLYLQVDSFYSDLNDVEAGLTSAMGIYTAQFPQARIPEFVSFISEFGYANVTFDKQIGIGLDMYMNTVFRDFYHSLEFPEFMIRKLRREYILPNIIKALGIARYESQTSRDRRFLAQMLYEGKVKYFTKALLPNVHDTLILGYTAAQLKWVEENEAEMWAHYAEKELLYKDEPTQYMRYLNDGPFTSADGVPQESAPAIGVWTGWKIIQSYMRKNPEVTLEQLMQEKDFDKILKLSRYKPH